MQIKQIKQPLPGENILAVAPKLAPEPDVAWNRRLYLHSGRALSDIALTTEQEGRAGRLTLSGQMLAPGVTSGLEAGLELAADENAADGAAKVQYVRVNPGTGLAASGEIVTLPQPLRMKVDDLPVYAPARLLDGAGIPAVGAEVARKQGPSLRELRHQGRALPRAGILVLEPIEVEVAGNNDPRDPCAVEAEAVAFVNRMRVDACRLVLFAWPTEILAVPDPGASATSAEGKTWRNRLAYAIFEQERKLPPPQMWPWQELGVAVGLVAFDGGMQPLFLDRFSVVRGGGKARPRTTLVAEAGSPELWQARIQQFAEEIAAAIGAKQAPQTFGDRFFFAPPIGLLPVETLDVRMRKFGFFPTSYAVDIRPVPLEQMDLAIQASAGLAPLRDDQPARVEVLVPVSQQWYEPRLLDQDEIASEFIETINRLIDVRAEWLARRKFMRDVSAYVLELLTRKRPDYSGPDPEALEPDEKVQTAPLNPREEIPQGLTVDVDGQGNYLYGEDSGLLLLHMSQWEQLYESVNGGQSVLRENEKGTFDNLGLADYVTFLDKRIRAADDIVDYHFLRVQTDMYRFRQRILGTEEANRLATSSVLAAIARGDSAYATNQDMQAFLLSVKDKLSEPQQSYPNPDDGDTPFVLLNQQGPARTPAPASAAAPAPQDAPLPGGLPSELFVAGGTTARAKLAEPVTRLGAAGFIDLESIRPDVIQELTVKIGSGARETVMFDVERAAVIAKEVAPVQAVEVSPGVVDAVKAVRADRAGNLLDTGTVNLRPPSKDDIIQQSPIVGQIFDFRTSVIGERLREPASGVARLAALATKYTAINAVITMDKDAAHINTRGVVVPGFIDFTNPARPTTFSLPIEQVAPDILQAVLRGQHDPIRPQGERSEADHFNAGIKALENTAGMLRSLEGRIFAYRSILQASEDCIARLQEIKAAIDRRLKEIGDELAEARHDVAVAKALYAEELERIRKINARRTAILQSHVPFVCFRRPRTALTVMDAPARVIDSGFVEPVVTACLANDVPTPAEIQRLVDLMRRAPLRWFSDFDNIIDLLDREASLLAALQAAKASAMYRQMQIMPEFALQFARDQAYVPAAAYRAYANAAASRVADGLTRAFQAQEQSIRQGQAELAALNLSDLAGLSWRNVRDRCRRVITIGDLIDANHGNSQVSQRAANALDNIAHVATCLYTEVSMVPGLLRLQWAELLSQYDAPVGLRNLGNLPGWGQQQEPDSRDRREMQSLVDWLFARIDLQEPDAVGLINDVVRVCILLASHSPVNQIIAGAVQESVSVGPGGMVRIAIDPELVRIGMPVAIYRGPQVVAQAVVADLIGGLATAQVITTAEPVVRVEKDARVQFSNAKATPPRARR
ncbi:MAG: hypothetical protein U0X20_22925 [Caldilineaceae bacterium]